MKCDFCENVRINIYIITFLSKKSQMIVMKLMMDIDKNMINYIK